MYSETDLANAVQAGIVQSLLNRYGLAMDTHRFELFDQVFVKDGLDCEFAGTRFTDREKLKADMLAYHAIFDGTSHSVTNMSWRFQESRAQVVSYGIARYLRHGTPGGEQCEIEGWYDDQIIKGPEGWRIWRRVARVWRVSGNPAVIPTGDAETFAAFQPLSLIQASRAGVSPTLLI